IGYIERQYYQDHSLTLARHPSETDERMMMRLLAFARHAGPALAFGKGVSTAEEPDLWQKDLTGAIELWIEVGQPDERRILKACGRAARVLVYGYGATAPLWWRQLGSRIERLPNLEVFTVPAAASAALAGLAERSMRLQCTLQDGQTWISSQDATLQIESMRQK